MRGTGACVEELALPWALLLPGGAAAHSTEWLWDGCSIGSSHLGLFHKNSNYCSPRGKDLYPLERVHLT